MSNARHILNYIFRKKEILKIYIHCRENRQDYKGILNDKRISIVMRDYIPNQH